MIELPITGYAVAGATSELAPEARRVPLPPPGTKRRGGRLPLLATQLARTAGADGMRNDTAVLFGTALGCLTETALFVEHMVEAGEATPKPRAFASSVHNAIASKVAMELGAHGECQTFSHGEVSFGHAAFAATMARARSEAPIVLGGLDEASDYVTRGLRSCELSHDVAEGGAVLHAGTGTPLAVLRVDSLRARAADAITVPSLVAGAPHASYLASITALAVGVVAGEVDPSAIGAATADCITLAGESRFGDQVLLSVRRP